MIVGQNTLLNQYVPTFYIKNLRDGQGLVFDSVKKAFVNIDLAGGGGGGIDRLGELLNVSPTVDNLLAVQDGQSLVWNSTTSLWENSFAPITLTGDATGTGPANAVPLTLNDVNLSPGTYGDDHYVPTITVNSKGLVTAITTQHVDTTVRDLVPLAETITVSARHQYIVMNELQVDGLIENFGVIAIL
jgi:hypothetical protein